MATTKQDKARVKRATEAWRAVVGRSPTETPDAWKVFFEAAMSVAEPTPEREQWVKQCTKHWKATIGKLKGEVYESLRALGERTPANVRASLSEIDPAFGNLTDDQVLRATNERSW